MSHSELKTAFSLVIGLAVNHFLGVVRIRERIL